MLHILREYACWVESIGICISIAISKNIVQAHAPKVMHVAPSLLMCLFGDQMNHGKQLTLSVKLHIYLISCRL
jgi:hypothetical protein